MLEPSKIRLFRCFALVLIVVGGFPGAAAASEARYRVESTFIHLGEVVAMPVVELKEGKTARVMKGAGDGAPNYAVAIKVTPATARDVNLSLSYDSGNLSIQPNRVVPLGETYRFTEDKVAVELRVVRLED